MGFVIKTFMLVLFSTAVMAHEMTPTYFKLKSSSYSGVYQAEMSMYNVREDSSYYEITVLDENFQKVPFAATQRIMNVTYLKRKKFTVFIRNRDVDRVVYICTQSKTLKGGTESTGITSRICSKKE